MSTRHRPPRGGWPDHTLRPGPRQHDQPPQPHQGKPPYGHRGADTERADPRPQGRGPAEAGKAGGGAPARAPKGGNNRDDARERANTPRGKEGKAYFEPEFRSLVPLARAPRSSGPYQASHNTAGVARARCDGPMPTAPRGANGL